MTDTAAIGVDEHGNPVYPPTPASPEELASTNRAAVLDPTTSTLTCSVEMARSTQYAAEKKAVTTYLKVAIPDTAIVATANGGFTVNPAFAASVDEVTKQMLGLCEAAAARQHGLEFAADDAGLVRVLNLFPGSKAGPAPTVATGTFAPPPAAAPAAAPVPAAVAPAPAPGVAPVPQGQFAPAAAPVPTAAPVPGAAAPAAAPAPAANANLPWGQCSEERKRELAAIIEQFCTTGAWPAGEKCYNNMTHESRYKSVKIGPTAVYGKVMRDNPLFGPATKQWVAQCIASGIDVDAG